MISAVAPLVLFAGLAAAFRPCTPSPLPYGVIPQLDNRYELALLYNALNLTNIGVEVGVYTGDYSLRVLQQWVGKTLVLVDPWETQDAEVYVDIANVEQSVQNARYQETLQKLDTFSDRIAVLRMYSVDAAARFPDESLDWVYLDARHDEPGVAEDLVAWYPKLKHGGIMAGHDYVPDAHYPEGLFGVRGAVQKFTAPLCIQALSTANRGEWYNVPSFYFFKP